MARTFWDGFDTYANSSGLDSQYAVRGGTINMVTGRFAGRALHFAGSTGNAYLGRNVSVAGVTEHTMGIAFYFERDVNTPSMFGWGFFNSNVAPVNSPSNRQIGWSVTHAGALVVYRGASTILWQSADGFIVHQAWNYIGLSALIHGSNGSFSVSHNGVQVEEQTGINTQGAGDLLIKYVSGGVGNAVNASDFSCDDLYLDDTYMSTPPERRVETLYPSADGSNLDLTPSTGSSHFGVVDETTLDTTDYLSGSTVGDYDELELTNLSNIPTIIDGLKAMGVSAKTDAATRAVQYGIRSNGSDALGSDIVLSGSPVQGFNNVLLNPDGSVAWDAIAVNVSKFLARVSI